MDRSAQITIFSIPKPFIGRTGQLQRNALDAWARLGVEILLLGDDIGVPKAASSVGGRHVSGIRTNSFGTPLVSDAFAIAKEISSTRLLCYSNADILFFDDFVSAIEVIHLHRFLAVGRRWDVDITFEVDLSSAQAAGEIRRTARQTGKLQEPWFCDYFVFPRASEWDLPDFAVGRPGWDGWLIHRAKALRVPVVDLTPSADVLHQNHAYEHVPSGSGTSYEGPEAEQNRALLDHPYQMANVDDATYCVRGGRLRLAMSPKYLKLRLFRASRKNKALGGAILMIQKVYRIRKRLFPTKGKY